jgi:signal transduction histidine kinase
VISPLGRLRPDRRNSNRLWGWWMDNQNVKIPGGMTVEDAHKFRELLTVIVGNLEMLQRQPLDDRGQKQLRRAELAARQLGEMIVATG